MINKVQSVITVECCTIVIKLAWTIEYTYMTCIIVTGLTKRDHVDISQFSHFVTFEEARLHYFMEYAEIFCHISIMMGKSCH